MNSETSQEIVAKNDALIKSINSKLDLLLRLSGDLIKQGEFENEKSRSF